MVVLGFATGLVGQEIYRRSFGEMDDPTIIFLHGGPGYNSASFEGTTARTLAEAGFRVVVYDRRGEGRSVGTADYSFAQSVGDLDSLYGVYGIERATLLGHSFGGIIATRFAEAHPERVTAVVLLAAPLSIPRSLQHILTSARQRYAAAGDTIGQQRLEMVASMDTASLMYSSMLLVEATRGGAYRPAVSTPLADTLRSHLRADTVLSRYSGSPDYAPVLGFYANEHYTTLDQTQLVRALAQQLPVYAIYGTEDGLYAPAEVAELEAILPAGHLRRVEGAAHNIFIDQQNEFIQQLAHWLH